MLKKRILASSLASVMALSSVSVVAFADETATADFGEAVTKAELKEYLKEAEKFMDKDLNDFGSAQSEQYEAAYEAAKVVADDSDASEDDVIAAYQMLKAVRNSLKNYTQADLKELISECKSKVDTKNVMNEEFGDAIWKEAGFDKFENAYDNAESCIDETDQRVLNDAYTELKSTLDGLEEYDKVTKAQFRSAYNQYIDLVNEFNKYESWRRGKATVGVNSGNPKKTAADENKLSFADKTITFGELKDIIYGTSTGQPKSLKDAIGNGGSWIKYKQSAGSVRDDIEDQYELFTTNKNSNVTSKPVIVDAYKACVDAVKVFNGWEVDNLKRGSKVSCNDLIDEYRSDILADVYKTGTALAATNLPLKDLQTALGTTDVAELTVPSNGKVNLVIKKKTGTATTVTIKLDPKSQWLITKADGTYNDAAAADTYDEVTFTGATDVDVTFDITRYLPLETVNIGTAVDDAAGAKIKGIAFAEALKSRDSVIAEEAAAKPNYATAIVNNGNVATIINDNNAVVSTSLKSVAYPIVYRAMKYALADAYAKPDTYKKKDVAELVKKANTLIDLTGDAELFSEANTDLDEYRKAAAEWVAMANADKTFKDNGNPPVYTDNSKYEIATKIDDTTNATEVYNNLNDYYKALNDLYNQYPNSYGDVAELLAEVAEGLDNNAYGKSAESIKAIAEDVAFRLSTLDDFKVADNVIYDDERKFIAYNRLDSKGTDGEKALYAAYNNLLKALEEASTENPDVVLGDLDGDNVANAKDALMIVQAAVGLITLNDDQKAAADFNNDGKVNSDDALAIVKAALGLN